MGEPSLGTPPSERPLEDRLDSWKEIASYLKRDVTTVQRWEKREGMPVHRHLHDSMGSVYASRADLDAWMRSRNLRAGQENGNNDLSPNPPAQSPPATSSFLTRWKFILPLVAIGAALAGGALFLCNRKAHAISETDTLVLADFANSTGNAVFDDTLKQALAVSLRQSPFLNVLSDEKVITTLRLMTLPPNTPLTPKIAREVCQRAESKSLHRGLCCEYWERIRDRVKGRELSERGHACAQAGACGREGKSS
jgi:hypothetical protein